jgi:hypothetical protein
MTNIDKLMDAIKRRDIEEIKIILDEDGALVNAYDDAGATGLHYAAFDGFREIVRLLLDRGAEINSGDKQFGATPAGWAIEYLRERGGFLGIELGDLAYAIEMEDVRWVARFLNRFPGFARVETQRESHFDNWRSNRATEKSWPSFDCLPRLELDLPLPIKLAAALLCWFQFFASRFAVDGVGWSRYPSFRLRDIKPGVNPPRMRPIYWRYQSKPS